MSVKKSLWISLALVMAMSLVFLGCPTEASESSGGRPAYEQTALWEAILEAQGILNATPVSKLAGVDIVVGTGYVTEVQYNAFSRDIESARTVAYGLRPSVKAITPTPEQQPALDDLDKAQTQFNAYKAANPPASGVKAEKAADIDVSTNDYTVITGNVGLGTTLDIGAKYVTIAAGAKLTTSSVTSNNKFSITNAAGKLLIKSGGTFEIVSGTDVGTDNFKGTIIVEDGGTFIDGKTGGLLATTSDDSGSYEINAGGVLISGTTVLVGPTAGANKGQQLQLKYGTIKIETPATGTPKKYTLAGDADLVGSLEVGGLAIDGTLTVAADLYGKDASTLLTGVSGAKIILTGSITILDAGTNWVNLEDDDITNVTVNTTIDKTLPWVFGGGKVTSGTPYKPYHSGHSGEDGFRLNGSVILQYKGSAWTK
jgi:hypothetical protein